MTTKRLINRVEGESGAAAVELSLMSLIFVPLTLMSVWFAEVLLYKMELQESVIASTFTFTNINYSSGQKSVNRNPLVPSNNNINIMTTANRAIWCDHSGVVDNNPTDPFRDCNANQANAHHDELAAHRCWLPGQNNQIRCQITRNFRSGWMGGIMGSSMPILASSAPQSFDDFQNGGRVTCYAQMHVFNNFIPKKFAQNFFQTDMISIDRVAGGQGGQSTPVNHANGTTGAGYITLREYKHSIETDTWATFDYTGGNNAEVEVDNSDPNSQQYRRAATIYAHVPGYFIGAAPAAIFAGKTLSDDLVFTPAYPYYLATGGSVDDIPLMPVTPVTGWVDIHMPLDNPMFFHMSALRVGQKESRADIDGGFSGTGYYTTPYQVGSYNREYSNVYSGRGTFYLGCRTAGGCT